MAVRRDLPYNCVNPYLAGATLAVVEAGMGVDDLESPQDPELLTSLPADHSGRHFLESVGELVTW